jgi:hypothetical protein
MQDFDDTDSPQSAFRSVSVKVYVLFVPVPLEVTELVIMPV